MGLEGIDGEVIVQPDRAADLLADLARLRDLRDQGTTEEAVIFDKLYQDEIKAKLGDQNPILFTGEPPVDTLPRFEAVWERSVRKSRREMVIPQWSGRMAWVQGGITYFDGDKYTPCVYVHTYIGEAHYSCRIDLQQLTALLSGQWRFAEPTEHQRNLYPSRDIGPAHMERG